MKAPPIAMTYLRYIKGKHLELAAAGDFHNLLGSSVAEPVKLLDKKFFGKDAARGKRIGRVKKLLHSHHPRQWGDERLIEAIRRHYQHGDDAPLVGAGGPIDVLPVAGSSPALWFVFQSIIAGRRRGDV